MSIFTSNPYLKAELSNNVVQFALYTGQRCFSADPSTNALSLLNCDSIDTTNTTSSDDVAPANSMQTFFYSVQQNNYGLIQSVMSSGKKCLAVNGNNVNLSPCNDTSSSQLFRFYLVGYGSNNTNLFALTNGNKCVQVTSSATLTYDNCKTTTSSLSPYDSFILKAGTIEAASATTTNTPQNPSTPSSDSDSGNGPKKGLVIGLSIAGAVLGIALITLGFVLWRKRQPKTGDSERNLKKNQDCEKYFKKKDTSPHTRQPPRGSTRKYIVDEAIASAVAAIPEAEIDKSMYGSKYNTMYASSKHQSTASSLGIRNNRYSTTSTATSGIVGMTTMVDDGFSEQFEPSEIFYEDEMIDKTNAHVSVSAGVTMNNDLSRQSSLHSSLFAKPLPNLPPTSQQEDKKLAASENAPVYMGDAENSAKTLEEKEEESETEQQDPAVEDSLESSQLQDDAPKSLLKKSKSISAAAHIDKAADTIFSRKSSPPNTGVHQVAQKRPQRNESVKAQVIEADSDCVAIYTYEQQFPDELKLNVGDSVHVFETFPDEWARGMNKTTGETGVFPKICLRNQSS